MLRRDDFSNRNVSSSSVTDLFEPAMFRRRMS